jgi:hypothetical protein
VAEISGASVDNKTKLELLKQEEAQIKLESVAVPAPAAAMPTPNDVTKTTTHVAAPSPVPSMKPDVVAHPSDELDFGAAKMAKETLVDKASEIITANEAEEIGDIIESLPTSSSKQVKAEIDELEKKRRGQVQRRHERDRINDHTGVELDKVEGY